MIRNIHMTYITKYILGCIGVFFTLIGCVEPFDFETETFESALVVDATITNEMKQQQVRLSRTYMLDVDGPVMETNAQVRVEETGGLVYEFSEIAPGLYGSDIEFGASPEKEYILKVTLANGKRYVSGSQKTPQIAQIDNVYAQRGTNSAGINGMSIYIDSFDPTGNADFFRYMYEETYKIIAPEYKDIDLEVTGTEYPDCSVAEVPRPAGEEVCYATVLSNTINQFSLNDNIEDRITKHEVRFIRSDNYIISHRYSILVKQFVQNPDAFFYFETLSAFAGEDNLFSQVQAGYIPTNMISENNSEEKILGFFEVATVSEQRLYFNYTDFYPNEGLPPYVSNCRPYAPDLVQTGLPPSCGGLILGLILDDIVYWDENTGQIPNQTGPFLMVQKPCGHCTALGKSEVPNFWID